MHAKSSYSSQVFPDVIHILIRLPVRPIPTLRTKCDRTRAPHPRKRHSTRMSRRRPKSNIVGADSAEKHEDTGDGVRRVGDAHPSHFFVR